MNRKSPEGGYRGKELEVDVLGTFKGMTGYELARKEAQMKSDREGNGYIDHGRAMRLVREYAKTDPTNPEKEFARDLRLEIIDQLKLEASPEAIKYYSAVGTELDHFHGIDAFVDQDLAGKRVTVTLDATLRTDKQEDGYKADVIVPNVPSPDSEDYLSVVQQVASEISEILRSRMEAERSRGVFRRNDSQPTVTPPPPTSRRRRAVDF